MINNVKTRASIVMDYLYSDEISVLDSCPPVHAAPQDLTAWRWTFNPYTVNCLSPVAKIEPKRLLSKTDGVKCSCWALSMFESQASAVKRMQELACTIPNFKATKGDHVSTVTISKADGVVTPPDSRGHFDFHPCKDFDMLLNSKVVGSIP